MKKSKDEVLHEMRAKLKEAEALAQHRQLEAEWLASQLARRGAKPENEMCQYVPERECANCGEDLPDCWLVAAGAEADAVLEAGGRPAKEA